MTTQEGVAPDSLVARMIGELNANPEARTLLLRALLTDDFLLLPAKVDRLMELPAQVDRLQEEVRQITTDLAPIKGSHARDAAQRAVRRIARIVNCRLQEQLNDDDLYDFTTNNDTTGITPEDLKSFENADIVLLGQSPRHWRDPLHCRRGVVHRRGGRHPPRPAQRPVPDAVHRAANPCRGGRTSTHTGSGSGHQPRGRHLVRNRAQTPRTGLSRLSHDDGGIGQLHLNPWSNPGRTV